MRRCLDIPDEEILAATQNNSIRQAARILGVPRTTLQSRLAAFELGKSSRLTDNQFIRAAKKFGTMKQAAQEMGYSRLDTFQRRLATIIDKHGDVFDFAPEPYTTPRNTLTYSHDEEFSILVFTDPHFWPETYAPQSPGFYVFLEVLEHVKPDLVLCCGDVFDGARVSRHPRIGWEDRPTVKQELEAAQEALGMIRDISPVSDLYWTLGNHDMRFENYLSSHAPELEGIEGTRICDWFPDWNIGISLNINDLLYAQHSWKGGRYQAWNNAKDAGISHVSGHHHVLWDKPMTDMRGIRYGICAGTLAWPTSPQFNYLFGAIADWQCGFYHIHVGKHITPEKILIQPDGTAVWAGRKWRG